MEPLCEDCHEDEVRRIVRETYADTEAIDDV
jgi:hypothetical protein